MLLAYKKSNLTVRSRKKSNQLEQNRDNFISLLNELNPYIRRASSRISIGLKTFDKDDLAQEARLRLFQTYSGKSEKDLPYFKKTAFNAMIDAYSRDKSDEAESSDFNDLSKISSDSTDATTVTDSLSRKLVVQKWIDRLPIRLQQIYELLYVKNFTQREAAAILGISQPRVAHFNEQLKARGHMELRHLDC